MKENNSTIHQVIIIGSGPAGLTAALYASRADLNPLLIEGMEPGGQLMQTTDVENFPGYSEGITGPRMIEDMRIQALNFGTKIQQGTVNKIIINDKNFTLIIDDDKKIITKTIIIATGASAKWLDIDSLHNMRGKGVSACATCDGAFFRNKHVLVIGGGDSAMEESLFLTKYASQVTIIHRKNKFRASKVMQNRVFNNPKITIKWNTELLEVLGEQYITGVTVKNNINNQKTLLDDVSGVFVAIGHHPNTTLFKGIIDLNPNNYIIVKEPSTKTNIPGIFACGDVVDPHYRQAITAAGSGCKAALDVENYLSQL